MSLAGVVGIFSTGTYTITRTATDSYASGVRTAGATTTLTADMSIQPLSGRDLKILPEGRRPEDIRKIWTRTALLLEPNADKITIGSETFEVFKVDYFGILSDHYVALAARVV